MNIDVYRDTDGSVLLAFAEGDAGILRFDSDGGWGETPEVPASAVLQADECDRDHERGGWSA
jgi:hypothetical protein